MLDPKDMTPEQWRAYVDGELHSGRQDRQDLWNEIRTNTRLTEDIKAKQDSLPAETAKAVADVLAARKAVRFVAVASGTGVLGAIGATTWHWVNSLWQRL